MRVSFQPSYQGRINFNKINNKQPVSNQLSFTAKTIAVTGNIASGKSTVQKLFEKYDIPSIDVDHVVHYLYEKDKPVIDAVKKMFKSFGIDSLENDNFIDRTKIRTLVFQDKKIKTSLEQIVHPAVNRKVQEFIQQNAKNDYVAIFNPLLFETNGQRNYDYVTLIKIEPQEQLKRLLNRNSFLTPKTAMERINSQLSQDIKENRADFVINNSFGLEQTETQVSELIKTLKAPQVSKGTSLLSGKLYLQETIENVLKKLGFDSSKTKQIFEDIMQTYDKTSRGYHGIKHIETMLKGFDDFMLHSKDAGKITNPNEFRFAILMHDYINGIPDDVEKSALKAEELLKSVSSDVNIGNIKRLILATDYAKENKNLSFDEKLMQDIDLMILGQNPYKYNNYSKLIRLQYSNYPDSVYNPARKQILQSFLERENIYNTDYYKQSLEQQATQNIANEIKSL